MRDSGTPISMVTAYDFPSAVHVDLAGVDVVLVGDSVGMVVLGYDTTLPVTFDEILHHCRAVSRGAKRPLLVGDLPFGSYEARSPPCPPNPRTYPPLSPRQTHPVVSELCNPRPAASFGRRQRRRRSATPTVCSRRAVRPHPARPPL